MEQFKLKDLERFKYLFEELLNLLIENQAGFTPGIRAILGILYDETCPISERMKEASAYYRHMQGV